MTYEDLAHEWLKKEMKNPHRQLRVVPFARYLDERERKDEEKPTCYCRGTLGSGHHSPLGCQAQPREEKPHQCCWEVDDNWVGPCAHCGKEKPTFFKDRCECDHYQGAHERTSICPVKPREEKPVELGVSGSAGGSPSYCKHGFIKCSVCHKPREEKPKCPCGHRGEPSMGVWSHHSKEGCTMYEIDGHADFAEDCWCQKGEKPRPQKIEELPVNGYLHEGAVWKLWYKLNELIRAYNSSHE